MKKIAALLKSLLFISLLYFNISNLLAQEDCENALGYTIGEEEEYSFEEEQTEFYVLFEANEFDLELLLSPVENEETTTIYNVNLYAYSDCDELELIYQRGMSDYYPSDNFILPKLIEGNDYLILLERTEVSGIGEKSFKFKTQTFYSYPCPIFSSECGELIKNGNFSNVKKFLQFSEIAFRDTLVCGFENAFEQYSADYISFNDSIYAVLSVRSFMRNSKLIQTPQGLLQNINVSASKKYSLTFDTRAGSKFRNLTGRGTNIKPDSFYVYLTNQISLDSITDSIWNHLPPYNRLPIKRYQKFIDSVGNKQLIVSMDSSQMDTVFQPNVFCFTANDNYDAIIFVPISNSGNLDLKYIGLDNISLKEFDNLDLGPDIALNECGLPATIGPDCVYDNAMYTWTHQHWTSDPWLSDSTVPNPIAFPAFHPGNYGEYILTLSIPSSTCSLKDTVKVYVSTKVKDTSLYSYMIPHGADVDWILANMTPKTGTNNVFENDSIFLGGLLTVDKLIGENVLTFKNCVIESDSRGKILVDNSSLILDGTSITVCDSNSWIGIELSSQDTLSQNSMGKALEMKNGVLIENAQVGIRTGQTNLQGQFIEGTAGAFFTSTGATFRNNEVDIKFHPYQNFQAANPSVLMKDLTEIYNTDFISDFILHDGLTTQNHIEMEGVDGIKIGGCNFDNQLLQSNYLLRGSAIEAVTSSFSVFDFQSERSSFKGFDQAIYSYTQNPLYTPFIRNSDFENNAQAISLNGNDYAVILENNIEVPDLASSLEPLGIYLNYCNAYQIEENEFTTDGSGIAQNAVGVLINQSNATVNELYNNSFEDFEVASLVQGDNKLSNGTGLEILCNDYDNDDYHIALTAISSMFGTTYPEIALSQGGNSGISDPAGNTFNDLCSGSATSDIFVDAGGSSFNYYHHSNGLTIPVCRTTSKVTNIDGLILYSNKQDACPTHLGSGGGGGSLPGGFRQKRIEEINLQLSGFSVGQKSGNDSVEYLINESVRLQLLADTVNMDSVAAVLAKSANPNNQVRMLAAMSRRGDAFFNAKSLNSVSKEAKEYIYFQQELQQGSGKIYENAKQDNAHPYYIWAKSADKQKNGTAIPAPVNLPNRKNQGINSSINGNQISVYPNPAKDQFYITVSEISNQGKAMERQLTVYNVNGRRIKSLILNSVENKFQINTENWATGIYLIRLTQNGEETESHKISIQ